MKIDKTIIKKRFSLITALILLALGLRLYLAFLPGFQTDTSAWYAWALRLNDVGLNHFYSPDIWTNYTPGYLYVLYYLGALRNLFHLDSNSFYYLLKLPAIITDLIIGYLIFKAVKKISGEKLALLGAAFFLFNPAILFDGSVWGQVDSVLALFMFSSIIALEKKRIFYSAFFFGIAFLIRPQAIALLPLFGFYFLKNFKIKEILKFISVTAAVSVAFFLPFFSGNNLADSFHLIINMINDYSYNSLFAFNFWGAQGFWIPDNTGGIYSMRNIGIALFIIYWLIILFYYFKKKIPLFSLAALATMSFYFLPTRVHERYLYPALPFLTLLIFQIRNRFFTYLTITLCLLFFVDLYYVYVYYNLFYNHISAPIYWLGAYHFIDMHANIFSVIETAIFGALSSLIILSTKPKNEKS
jgi:dolichyl-phosphate-mannose-protein mannosyltransferase